MSQRLSLSLALALGLVACGPPADRKNVLLVTLDTTRADYLGSYGAPGDPTPHLDRLASQGTRFDMAIATASLTPVAHASILTGRANHEHGLRVLTALGGYRLPGNLPTLATILDGEGYRTHAIHSAFPVSSYFGFERGFQSFDDIDTDFGVEEQEQHQSWNLDFQRRSDETSDRAIEFLEGTDQPFLLWLHYWDPHDGTLKPPSFERQSGLSLYAAEVNYMDGQLGRVFDHLRASGLMDSTLVLVVADHGQGLKDHDWRGHRILYQEQIRVPLLLHVPGHEQVASVPDLVRTPDILPTLLDYLGLDPPPGIFGQSLRGLMEGRADHTPRLAFADQINLFDANAKMVEERPKDAFLYCAMDRQWKLIYRPHDPALSELYDLESDPKELRNVYAERPDQVLRLMTELAQASPWITSPFPPYDDDDRGAALEALNALGYAAGSGEEIETDLPWVWVCANPEHAERLPAAGHCAVCETPLVPRVDPE